MRKFIPVFEKEDSEFNQIGMLSVNYIFMAFALEDESGGVFVKVWYFDGIQTSSGYINKEDYDSLMELHV